jgi:hypothetical protein
MASSFAVKAQRIMFDLKRNVLRARTIPNPSAGTEHVFRAWRLADSSDEPVAMRQVRVDDESGQDEK